MSRQAIANIASIVLLVLVVLRATGGGGVLPIPIPVPPSPKPGSWIVLIEETSERDDSVSRLLSDKAWFDALKAKQLNFRAYDDDQPEAASYLPHAESAGQPAIVVVDPGGELLGAFKLPEDRASLDAKVKEATGL